MVAKPWKNDEINYLLENAGFVKISTIAKILNRPMNGVTIKMKQLNISNTKNQIGLLTMGELAQLINVDRKTVENWCHNHNLPYTKKKTRIKKTFYFVDPIDFWEWAYFHQDRINFSKIPSNVIVPEPDWVDKQRLTKRKTKGNYYCPWTTEEEKILLKLRNNGETYNSIAKRLNRTVNAVTNKYKRLTENRKV